VFARVTTYELELGRASEAVESFQPAIELIRGLDGLVEAFFLVERDGQHAMSITLWESIDAMERSRVAASRARTDAAMAVEAEVRSTFELDVGIRAAARPVDDGSDEPRAA